MEKNIHDIFSEMMWRNLLMLIKTHLYPEILLSIVQAMTRCKLRKNRRKLFFKQKINPRRISLDIFWHLKPFLHSCKHLK